MSKPQRIVLDIKGMTCDSCAAHVTKALATVPGVLKVDVPGWQSARAEVIAGADVPVETLTKAVQEADYSATLREAQPLEDVHVPAVFRHDGPFDLMIIGGGSAGFAAAIKAAEMDARVAIVESGTIGGTCVNVGCVPSKALIRAMEAYHDAGTHRFQGVHATPGTLNWPQVIAHKDALIAELRQTKYEEVLAAYPQITYLKGQAVLTGDTSLRVDRVTYTPGKIILATGASPWAPPIQGLAETGFLTSTTAMSLPELPRSLIILGANAVGLEMAQVFARAGSAVTVIELLQRVAPFEDISVSQALEQYLTEEGISFVTGAVTQRVRRDGFGYRLVVQRRDRTETTFTAEQLLVATGRHPNTAGLGLDAAGVAVNKRGAILLNQFAQTTNSDIYVAGDCADLPMFVYVAAHSGTVAAENAIGGNQRPLKLEPLPKVTFTDPQVASAGLTEQQAIDQGYDTKVSTLPLAYLPKALAAHDTRGIIKLVADKATDRLLGAHIVAPSASEIIQTAVIAMEAEFTIQQLADMLFPYLTLSEGIKLAAQTFEKDVTKLSCCAG